LTQTVPCPIEFVGVNDRFGESGDPDELAEKYRLTAPWIASAAKRVLKRKIRP
jgi:transketolase